MEQERRNMEGEETDVQKPSIPTLCANNCGFFGSSATNNLCSKCYKDVILSNSKAALTAVAQEKVRIDVGSGLGAESCDLGAIEGPSAPVEGPKRTPGRCCSCNKKVGLMGFTCRCGEVFCSVHRYSEKHNCAFDYKDVERDAIARANPVVKAEKVEKI